MDVSVKLIESTYKDIFDGSTPLPASKDLFLDMLENKLELRKLNVEQKQKLNNDDNASNDSYKFEWDTKEENHFTEDDEERQKLYFHYMVLKRMYPNETVPEMTAFSSINVMKEKYKLLTRRLALDKHINDWKKYIIVAMCILELIMSKLTINSEGFARHQIKSLGAYDQLLAEMADKYYELEPQSSVELRLATTLLMNGAVFMLGRILGGQPDFLGMVEAASKDQ